MCALTPDRNHLTPKDLNPVTPYVIVSEADKTRVSKNCKIWFLSITLMRR